MVIGRLHDLIICVGRQDEPWKAKQD